MQDILRNHFTNLPYATEENIKKAKKIKLILTDVDGCLTDGGLYFNNEGLITKKFNTQDGQLLSFIKKEGMLFGMITGRDDQCVSKRASMLNADFYIVSKNKLTDALDIIKKANINMDQVAYLGDDLIDLELMNNCGISASPLNAQPYIYNSADIKLNREGGDGAFREFLDFILFSNKLLMKKLSF